MEYICPVCKKGLSNENGLRGHLQMKRDDEHRRAFQEYNPPAKEEGTISASADEQPVDEQIPQEITHVEESAPEQTERAKEPINYPPPLAPSDQTFGLGSSPPTTEQEDTTGTIDTPKPNITEMIQAEVQKALAPKEAMTREDIIAPRDFQGSEQEPWEWFRQFLIKYAERYGLRRNNVELLADRVKIRRGELPLPPQLQRDITIVQSQGITADGAQMIAEIYHFQLEEYKERMRQKAEYRQQPWQGIKIQPGQAPPNYGNVQIPVPQQPQLYPGATMPTNPPTQSMNYPQQFTNPPMQPYNPTSAVIQQEAQRLYQLQNTFQQQNPLTKEVEELKIQLKERDNREREDMRRRLDERDRETANLEEKNRSLEAEKTQIQFNQLRSENRQRATPQDVEIERLNKNHDLEMSKQMGDSEFKQTLAENIPSAISDGVKGVVEGIKEFKREEQQAQTPGSFGSNMWQQPCPNPNCDALITAPQGQSNVYCGKCHTWYETGPPQPQQPNQGSFTVQQPPVDNIPQQPPSNPPPENNPVPTEEPTNEPIPSEPPPELPLRPDTGRIADTAPKNQETPINDGDKNDRKSNKKDSSENSP